ncbi:CheR family methyltransferase [Desulfovibrio sp. UCD-KL4C]|uniref:CheR family methyltransferase n=1 Tax=Desulfovibrio sp. UCD-KL4C TaxID=2578120 RepID=UPI0025BF602E|nr:CheR family methyltransferase [Desulfovibrio sp. UCD-KL4C]
MNDSLSDNKIDLLSQLVRKVYGLKFSHDRWEDLKSAIVKVTNATAKFKSAEDCLDHLLSPNVDEEYFEIFINQLTIGETYFFRDPVTLNALEQDVLHEKRGKGSGRHGAVRVWSVACATGEEPYSIAIMCHRSNVRCEIFGTDVDSEALQKASEGNYRKWSFRIESNNFKKIYFKSDNPNFFQLDKTIKNMVSFSRLNLIGEALPSYLWGMDIVLCRNVLIYFSEDGVRLVLDKIWESLNWDGWLVVTPSESALITAYGKFEPVNIGATLIFRKNEKYNSQKYNETLSNFYNNELNQCPASETEEDIEFDELMLENEELTFCTPEPDLLYSDSTEPIIPSDLVDISVETSSQSNFCNPVEEARALRKRGDYAAALSCLQEALESNLPRNVAAKVLFAIAEIKADSGLLDEAVNWCIKAIEIDRVAPSPHFLLGQIKMSEGDLAGAQAELRKAIFLDSSFVMAHFVLGNIYLSQKNNSAAARHFSISLQEVEKIDKNTAIPHSDGITAGRLAEMIKLVKNNIV